MSNPAFVISPRMFFRSYPSASARTVSAQHDAGFLSDTVLIRSVILASFGITSDATHLTAPDETATGATKAMLKAMRDANVSPEDIDYINAHGTATLLGDVAETRAIKRALGDHAYKVSISSTKSQIGHLLGACGAVEAICALLAMRDGIVPPTINLENPDPECDLDYTPLVAKERKMKIALSNSFGFGGHNGCLVLGRWE